MQEEHPAERETASPDAFFRSLNTIRARQNSSKLGFALANALTSNTANLRTNRRLCSRRL